MTTDFLIIGHGIAGVCMFEHLVASGKKCLIINEEKAFSSSKVAAGLYNPITGRKMNETWLAEALFPYLLDFYMQLEKKLQTNFLINKPIYRPFASIEDQNDWLGKSSGKSTFVTATYTTPQYGEFIDDKYGGILLNNAGFINLKSLLKSHSTYLLNEKLYHAAKFDYRKLNFRGSTFEYDTIKAKHLIFCDGPLSSNPYFNWVPTAPVKGEILHIKTAKELPEHVIFNKGVFIIKDTDNDYYRVGSTYNWRKLDTVPTEEARLQLEQKLRELLKIPFEVVDQVAGIRPASKDRKPLIGAHPEISNMYTFNGLGTKGVSLAPYFAKSLTDNIIYNKDLQDEVNISRYNSLYLA